MKWPKRIAVHCDKGCKNSDGEAREFCAHAITRDEPTAYYDERIYVLQPKRAKKRRK